MDALVEPVLWRIQRKRACSRYKQGVTPGVAVFGQMNKPKRDRSHYDAGHSAKAPHEQRLRKAPECKFLA